MSNALSKTVRIDLMPPPDAGASVPARNELLKNSNFSTRQRQTAKATAQVRSRYEELLESVYDAAVIASPAGKIIEVNGRAIEFLGYERDVLCGEMTLTDLIDGADDQVMRSISETLVTERFALLQAFCKRQDGSLFPAEIAVNRLSMDNVRLCFFIRDVSVRYQTEEQLRVEHAAIQICASGIAISTTAGILDYVNPAFAALVGLDADDLPGHDIREILPSAEHIDPLIESALASDQTWVSEFATGTLDGRTLYLQMAASCIFMEDGTPRGIVFALADFTAHHKIETESLGYLEELKSRTDARTEDWLAAQEQLKSRIAVLEDQLRQVTLHLEGDS
jgi:PAS domain S-box-containing protein